MTAVGTLKHLKKYHKREVPLVWNAVHSLRRFSAELWVSIHIVFIEEAPILTLSSEMYFLVSIKQSHEKVILPIKWIKNLNLTKLLNKGLVFIKKHNFKVFISLNCVNEEPDFQLAILEKIDFLRPACYISKVLKCFGACYSLLRKKLRHT